MIRSILNPLRSLNGLVRGKRLCSLRLFGSASVVFLLLFASGLQAAGTGRFLYGNDLLLANTLTYARLDGTFNSMGFLTDNFGSTNSQSASAVVVQADGKIVVAGMANLTTLGLIRYNADGTRDSSFGTEGKVVQELAEISAIGWSMALQPDG